MSWLKKHENILVLVVVAFFLVFALICRWTPAAGDDWVYASGGKWNNPFERTWSFYFTWSGRILSEFYGFCIAPHKNIWNVLNPALFTGIFCMILKNSEVKKYPAMTALLLMTLIFSVSDRLRMQTFTWIMGTTYVIPLLLFLIYVYMLKRWIFDNISSGYRTGAMILLNLCIPLYMENAAALVVGADILIIIYLFFMDRSKLKQMVLLFVFACIGAVIILKSPGAASRLVNDNAAFSQLSIFEKIVQNWSALIYHTYQEQFVMTCILSLVCAVYAYQKISRIYLKSAMIIVFLGSLLLNQGILYIVATIMMIIMFLSAEENQNRKWFHVFLMLCALGANGVMLLSPIFDSRSAIYTVFILFTLTCSLLNEIEIRYVKLCSAAVFCSAAFVVFTTFNLYRLVHVITIKRNEQIAYYQQRPDAGEAWILAYPDESIHSANIEAEDQTHMYYFKEYYYLDQSLDIVFYYLPEYSIEAVRGA